MLDEEQRELLSNFRVEQERIRDRIHQWHGLGHIPIQLGAFRERELVEVETIMAKCVCLVL